MWLRRESRLEGRNFICIHKRRTEQPAQCVVSQSTCVRLSRTDDCLPTTACLLVTSMDDPQVPPGGTRSDRA